MFTSITQLVTICQLHHSRKNNKLCSTMNYSIMFYAVMILKFRHHLYLFGLG
uniref:Uncharacterized protein n=1 Tax=Rhizophora mucronata TaxID=61149 RepID=A0A2P2LRL6_RHIMU